MISESYSYPYISIPEGDRYRDVHFDPECEEVCGIHSYDLSDKLELWLSQWDHFLCSQEDLLALGADRVGCCYLVKNLQIKFFFGYS